MIRVIYIFIFFNDLQEIVLILFVILFIQINYVDMLKRIDLLRNELKDLEIQVQENQQKAEEVNKIIVGLEKSIVRYKEEYVLLISQVQVIKIDLFNVEVKVGLYLNICIDINRKKIRKFLMKKLMKLQLKYLYVVLV